MIDVSLAGRAAEELVYGPDDVTIGAVSVLQLLEYMLLVRSILGK